MRAGIALGSNLGDRRQQLSEARRHIVELPDVSPPILFSSIYETEPINCETGAGKFLNAVIEVGFERAPLSLLHALRGIEEAMGRPPRNARNRSRTIDLDLLYCGDWTQNTPELQLPHPRLHLRRFVLEPLVEIRPDLKLPGNNLAVRNLLTRVESEPLVVRALEQW
jgi:2-amino-4-hydroxy-6-hydroxymethyldihydropteridine diphosphokinase